MCLFIGGDNYEEVKWRIYKRNVYIEWVIVVLLCMLNEEFVVGICLCLGVCEILKVSFDEW